MDLSPREVVPTAPRGRRKPWFAYVVLALVVATGGVVVAKFLTSALDYYCNVDEIGVKSGCDEGRNIRVQGVVEQGSVEHAASAAQVSFVITFNGASLPVRLGTEPTGLFQECIPVVVAGKVIVEDGDRYFAGNEVLVKHDNEYDAENEDRIDQVNAEAAACSRKG